MSDLWEHLNTALADRYSIERTIGSGIPTVDHAEHLEHRQEIASNVLRQRRRLQRVSIR
jgi:hypothetical protein